MIAQGNRVELLRGSMDNFEHDGPEGWPEQEARPGARDHVTATGRLNRCPRCRSRNVARIIYGLVDGSFLQHPRSISGDWVAGGAVVSDESPGFYCHACRNRWGDVSSEGKGVLRQMEDVEPPAGE